MREIPRLEPLSCRVRQIQAPELDDAEAVRDAAQDLLDALEACVARVEVEGGALLRAWLPSARAAIAKAKEAKL